MSIVTRTTGPTLLDLDPAISDFGSDLASSRAHYKSGFWYLGI